MFLLKTLAIVDSIFLLSYILNWSVTSVIDFTRNERIIFGNYKYFWMYVVVPLYGTVATASYWLT